MVSGEDEDAADLGLAAGFGSRVGVDGDDGVAAVVAAGDAGLDLGDGDIRDSSVNGAA